MTVLRLVLLISLGAMTAMAQENSSQRPLVPASCPVTVPSADPFIPPAPFERGDNKASFLLGTEKLWTILRTSGVWGWAPRGPGREHQVQPLTEKVFWMSVDFHLDTEPYPELKVTGRRLDGSAPPLLTLPTTNAIAGPNTAMLTGIRVPTPGCWEITGDYKGQKLSFVVWVQPNKLVK